MRRPLAWRYHYRADQGLVSESSLQSLDDYLVNTKGPQDVVTLKRVRDKLMADETNLPTSEWQPESESTFSDGQGHVQVREHL